MALMKTDCQYAKWPVILVSAQHGCQGSIIHIQKLTTTVNY